MTEEKNWGVSDILYGIIVPFIIAAIIIIFPAYLKPAIADETLKRIFIDGLCEAILVLGVPLLFGLLWNQWAGGAAGFLTGSIYSLYVNDMYVYYGALHPNYGYAPNDISVLGYLVCAMVTGYIAGALNKKSYSFRRMLISGLVASIIGGFFFLWTTLISPLGMATDLGQTLYITFLPRIIYGIVMPIIAKIFTWYGIILKHT